MADGMCTWVGEDHEPCFEDAEFILEGLCIHGHHVVAPVCTEHHDAVLDDDDFTNCHECRDHGLCRLTISVTKLLSDSEMGLIRLCNEFFKSIEKEYPQVKETLYEYLSRQGYEIVYQSPDQTTGEVVITVKDEEDNILEHTIIGRTRRPE